jgi:sugar lactone lactonase YvrE
MARGRGGEIYVSDVLGHRILRFDADGTESVVAGTGAPGFAGDGALATVAQVHTPRALSMSPDGEVYVAEFGRVRRITFDGRIETVLNEHANGLAHDRSGALYMSTSRNIFLVSAEGVPTRIAGRETAPGLNEGGLALDSRILDPRGLTVSADGEVYFADAGLHLVRRLIQNAPASLTMVSGNNQTAVLNERPPEPLRVRVTGRTGQPVAGVVVNFSVTSGTVAPISSGNVRTDRDGYAQFHGSLGQRTGRITMRASVPGLDPVEFVVTVP